MPTPYFICFVALREEMGNIDARLREGGVGYIGGHFDQSRSQHHYQAARRAAEPVDLTFIVLEEMGNIACAAVVSACLTFYRPQAAFLLGIAGTLDLASAGLGDVIVSSSAKFIGPNKISNVDPSRFKFEAAKSTEEQPVDASVVEGHLDELVEADVSDAPRAQTGSVAILDPMKRIGEASWLRFRRHAVEINASKRQIANFQKLQKAGAPVPLQPVDASVLASDGMEHYRNPSPKIRTGAILGSEWVVDSEEFNTFLLSRGQTDEHDYVKRFGTDFDNGQQRWFNEDLVCLDMESYGFFRAIDEHRNFGGGKFLHAFSIRGISDPCRNKKGIEDASGRAIRAIAVGNAVETLVDFVFFFADQDVCRTG